MYPITVCLEAHTARLIVSRFVTLLSSWVFVFSVLPWAHCELQVVADPRNFPAKLQQYYADLDNSFHCDYNERNMCGFVVDRLMWSFHKSLRELAQSFSLAAEADAKSVYEQPSEEARFSTASFKPVEVNLFPCAVGPQNQSAALSEMEWSIPWPHFYLHQEFKADDRKPERHADPPVLACVHLSLRFPANRASHFSLHFTLASQKIALSSNIGNQTATVDQSASDIHKVNDLLIRSDSSQIPRDTWIELKVPVHMQFPDEITVTNTTRMPTLATFTVDRTTWVVRETLEVLRIQTTPDVCVDNFRFTVWAHRPKSGTSSTVCLRSLAWHDPTLNRKRLLRIDENGTPVASDRGSNLSTVQGKSTIYPHGFGGWMRLTGSLILGLSTTLLFVLLIVAICISVLFAHHRRVNHRFSKALMKERKRLPSNCSPDPGSASLLGESSSEKFDSTEQEYSSIQCNESLFHNSTGTSQSGNENHNDLQEFSLDTSNMSAVQLMRNWYFYRRRGQRARHINPHPQFRTPHRAAGLPFVRPRKRDSAVPANPQARRSLIISVDSNHQLILLPEQSHANMTTASDHPLDSIPELIYHHTQVDQSVHNSKLQMTPSTVPRSELSTDFHYDESFDGESA